MQHSTADGALRLVSQFERPLPRPDANLDGEELVFLPIDEGGLWGAALGRGAWIDATDEPSLVFADISLKDPSGRVAHLLRCDFDGYMDCISGADEPTCVHVLKSTVCSGPMYPLHQVGMTYLAMQVYLILEMEDSAGFNGLAGLEDSPGDAQGCWVQELEVVWRPFRMTTPLLPLSPRPGTFLDWGALENPEGGMQQARMLQRWIPFLDGLIWR